MGFPPILINWIIWFTNLNLRTHEEFILKYAKEQPGEESLHLSMYLKSRHELGVHPLTLGGCLGESKYTEQGTNSISRKLWSMEGHWNQVFQCECSWKQELIFCYCLWHEHLCAVYSQVRSSNEVNIRWTFIMFSDTALNTICKLFSPLLKVVKVTTSALQRSSIRPPLFNPGGNYCKLYKPPRTVNFTSYLAQSLETVVIIGVTAYSSTIWAID